MKFVLLSGNSNLKIWNKSGYQGDIMGYRLSHIKEGEKTPFQQVRSLSWSEMRASYVLWSGMYDDNMKNSTGISIF